MKNFFIVATLLLLAACGSDNTAQQPVLPAQPPPAPAPAQPVAGQPGYQPADYNYGPGYNPAGGYNPGTVPGPRGGCYNCGSGGVVSWGGPFRGGNVFWGPGGGQVNWGGPRGGGIVQWGYGAQQQ